jgi:predicted DNA-binding ribbon-helix-helix protein
MAMAEKMTHASGFFKRFDRKAHPGENNPMPRLRKRSVLLAGHATSIALEPEFWAVLDDMAQASGKSLAALVVEIDQSRADRPLASACRVAALAFARR